MATGTKGYGVFTSRLGSPTTLQPHRVAKILTDNYEAGKPQIDHLCRNKLCCNPTHLEWVTSTTNNRRRVAHLKAEGRWDRCSRGHELSGENRITRPSRPGQSECRKCLAIRIQKQRKKS